MTTSTGGRGQQERFTMDVWDQNMNGTKYGSATLPTTILKRRFRKPRQSKARWYLIIGVSVAIVIVAVVVIALAIHFATGSESNEGTSKLQDNVETFHLGDKTSSTSEPEPTAHSKHTTAHKHTTHVHTMEQKHSTQHKRTTGTSHVHKSTTRFSSKTSSVTSKMPDGRTSPEKESTNHFTTPSSPKSITRDMNTSPVQTSRPTFSHETGSERTGTSSGFQISSSKLPTLATTKSSSVQTSSSHSTSSTSDLVSKQTLTSTQEDISIKSSLKPLTSTPGKVNEKSDVTTTRKTVNLDTTTASLTTSDLSVVKEDNSSDAEGNKNQTVLTFESSNITLPFTKSPLTLKCVAMFADDWVDLKIVRHQGKDKFALARVTSGIDYPSVYVIDANFSSEVSYKQDALMVTLMSDAIGCSYIGDYSCVISTPTEIKEIRTEVHAIHSQPKLEIPTSIIEGGQVTLKCSTEVMGGNGTLKWKFRPPGLQTYFDLSLQPTTSTVESSCSTIISSVLTFNPQMHDNGSFFRCETTNMEDANLAQTLYSEQEFFVVSKSFCDDKRLYSINSHPINSCDMVIYCFVDGPRVYQIDCDPGSCYDISKTQCVSIP